MPMIYPGHAGLQQGNRNWPIWNFGAYFYWRSSAPEFCQIKGGRGVLNKSFVDDSDYWIFDPGKGQFQEVAFDSKEFQRDGYFTFPRSVFFNDNQDADRGPFTLEAGLTKTNPAFPAHYIVDPTTITPASRYTVDNSSGSAKRVYRSESSSSSFNRMWSLLVHRTDDGPISGSVLTLFVADNADPLGPNIASGTQYVKIREDNWYLVYADIPVQGGAPSVYYGIILEDGFEIDIECPQTESFTAGSVMEYPTHRVPAPSGAPAPPEMHFNVERLSGVAEAWPASGWLGATVVMPYPSGEFTIQTGYIVDWRASGNDRIAILLSNFAQGPVFWVRRGGTSEAFLDGITTWGRGEVFGIVGTWGYRKGSRYFVLAVNGQQIDLDVSGSLPTGSPTLQIGSNGTGSHADSYVQAVAGGNHNLTRLEARHLSLWFKKQALSKLSA